MKAGIVKLSTVQKHGRWDAQFYLGDPALPDEIAAAHKRRDAAIAAADKKIAQLKEEQQRVQGMVDSGEVTEFSA